MCQFFCVVITRGGNVLFTEEDSHETVIACSGLKDDGEQFVRAEYNHKMGYKIDEGIIPEWYERIAAKAEANVKAIFAQVESVRGYYEKIERFARVRHEKTMQSARVEYERIEQPAYKSYVFQIENIDGYVGRISERVEEKGAGI